MDFDVDKVIYGYLLICAMVLLYNIFYIVFSNRQKKNYYDYANQWQKSIEKQMVLLKAGNAIEPKHKEYLEKRLTSTRQLISYAHALDTLRGQGENLEGYLIENYIAIQSLAYQYKKKEVADRAFFAFFISNNAPCDGEKYNSLMEVLLSYLDDSTIYCRENVLKALYALGNSQAVENAFQIMNERKWFHHHKLISDGLMTFNGDKEDLAERMWNYLKKWEENLLLAVIKFITVTSDKFKERLFVMLQSGEFNMEVQLAILRYYRNHVYKPIQPLLISYLEDENIIDENIRIVTASVLDKYPGKDTVIALKNSLKSSNWYVRYNSASSLMSLRVDVKELQDIMQGDDRYAKEIIAYITSLEKKG